MTLNEYVRRHGRGTILKLTKSSGLGYQTVLRAVYGTRATTWATAQKLARATGYVVDAAEICKTSARRKKELASKLPPVVETAS